MINVHGHEHAPPKQIHSSLQMNDHDCATWCSCTGLPGGSDKITCDNVAASGANLHTECRTFSRSLVSACSSVCERRLPTS